MNPPNISDLMIERYLLGELPPEQQEQIRACMEHDADLRLRFTTLESSNREILETYPVRPVIAEIRRRAESEKRPRTTRWLAMTAPVIMATAAAMIFVVRANLSDDLPLKSVSSSSELRLKGLMPHLMAYRVRSGKAERLESGAKVRPSETIQLRYVSAGKRYGMVLSLDGRGGITLHMPEGSAQAASLESEAILPSAFVLDDAPNYEQFFFVVSNESFSVETVKAAVRSLALTSNLNQRLLPLPNSFTQFSLVLKKESP